MEGVSEKTVELKVTGMTCSNCALGIQKALEKDGIKNIFVDFASGTVRYGGDDAAGQAENVIKRIESLGFAVSDGPSGEIKAQKGLSPLEWKFYISAFLAIPLMLAMFLPIPLLHNGYFQLAITLPVFIIGLNHFGKSAFNSIRAGVANMDVLVFLGTSAAFIYSMIGTIFEKGHDYMFYEIAAAIIAIILLGNLLEQRAVKKTTSAVNDLVRLQRSTAKRIQKRGLIEQIDEVDASAIQKGDLVLINSGDIVPVDGEIYWGSGTVDESMITGESMPVEKGLKDHVVGGTILLSGTIKVLTTAIGEETVLSQIIEMVKIARQDKPKLQNMADRISAIFVPVVVVISFLTVAGWALVGQIPFGDALMKGIAVLVIACPCALGLAIPTAVVVGLGRMARNGILVKGATTLDRFAGINTVIFDKTGTLTTGKFKVKAMHCISMPESEVQGIISAMEKHSQHPIAKALVAHLGKIAGPELAEVFENKGVGLQATGVDGQRYQLGSYAVASHLTDDHNHNVYLVVDGNLAAWIDVEDDIKSEAYQAVKHLKNKGLHTVLLSGDFEKRCGEVSMALGIEEVYSKVLPKQKLELVKVLSDKGRVAMVGDGINDAPALARADVGISMTDATQIAVKSADVVILRGNLNLITTALELSKLTLRTMRENLFWAFFYNVAAIPLAIAGLLTPMVAAGAMAASSLIVVLNSARLKHRKLS